MKPIKYEVSEQRRQLWEIELDISNVLLDICNRMNLKIWAGYGTLLGAARHKGFIPWDDDMDFVMMRDDYDKLLALILSKDPVLNLPEGYEFDITNIRAIKLKRKDTTMKPAGWKYSKGISYGVWVDILSLDVAPDDVAPVVSDYERLKWKIIIHLNGTLRYYAASKNLIFILLHFFCRWFMKIHNSNNYRKKIENHLRDDAHRYSGNKIWGFMIWSTMVGVKKIKIYDKSWFDETVMMPFEEGALPCPKEYEKVLTAQYGDWRTPIMGASQHEGAYVNIDLPYADYIEDFLSKKPWWERYWYKK